LTNSYSEDRDKRKREYWRQNKTPWQIMKTEIKIKWRRFQTQTHNMGGIMVLFMIMMLFLFAGSALLQLFLPTKPTIMEIHTEFYGCKPNCYHYQ